jgi:hypothetical protein
MLFNVYSPPDKPIHLNEIEVLKVSNTNWMTVGDINSHSPNWGYEDIDKKGEQVEDWSITNNLQLLNDPDDTPTYYSRRWRKTSTPDLALASEDMEKTSVWEVCQQLGGSDHRPVIIQLNMKA